MKPGEVAVIVNDMSDINIDAELIRSVTDSSGRIVRVRSLQPADVSRVP